MTKIKHTAPSTVERFNKWMSEYAKAPAGSRGDIITKARAHVLKTALAGYNVSRVVQMTEEDAETLADTLGCPKTNPPTGLALPSQASSGANTYVALEPEEVTAYLGADGELYPERDEAVEANFKVDLRKAISQISAPVADHTFEACLIQLSQRHPDMLRILTGDRDYT